MKEYEIHISASHITDGGTKEWDCFKEYIKASNVREAKKSVRRTLKEEGFKNISLEAIEVR